MENRKEIKYVDTITASVKMTGGVPFKGGVMSDSSSDEDMENHCDVGNSSNHTKPVNESSSFKSVATTGKNDHNMDKSQRKENNGAIHEIMGQQDGKENLVSQIPSNHLPQQVGSGKLGENNIESQRNSSSLISQDKKIYQNAPNHLPFSERNDSKTPSVSTQEPAVPAKPTTADTASASHNHSGREIIRNTCHQPVNIPQANAKRLKGMPGKKSDASSEWNDVSGFTEVKSSLSPKEQSWLRRSSFDNMQGCIFKEKEKGIVTSSSLTAIASSRQEDASRHTRVNPFNNDLLMDEDHFSDTVENYFRTKRHSTGSTKSSSVSHEWGHDRSEVTFAELGLSEDHFSHPQGHFGLSGVEELELAIENCKELIKEAPQDSDKQKNLVLKLVQLRIKLQELKEGPEQVPENVKVILSHKMLLKNSRTSKYYCEKCNGAIWGMLQVWYRCTECGYRCHEKCLQQILRTCAKAKVLENPTLIFDITPKEPNGLACQNFRCAECRSPISFKVGQSEPRLCNYNGRYYCELCHWNDTFIIPARVLHNWDFTPHKVCRASKQFLKLMQKKAVIRIQDVNPMLFVYVDQLNEIKKLREEMMIMKKYILSCVSAMSAKLLLMLENRQHFVESSDRYSMQDLLDAEDILLPELVNIHSTWAQHIKVDCELCQGRGFCCELCGDEEILFPFDNIAVVCPKCAYVSHRHCFAKKCICPRCERREKRMAINS